MVKRTTEEWRVLLSRQQTSGLTQAEWCAVNGVNLNTFRDRTCRIKRQDRNTGSRTDQRDAAKVSWIGVKPESLIEIESLPAAETNLAKQLPASSKGVSPTNESKAIEAEPQKEHTDIHITREGWTITVAEGFEERLLAGVLRVVNQVCC